MPLPNFLVLGVAKAGTTSLHAYLAQHPQIYMSPRKEPHFFAYGEAPLPDFTGPDSQNARQRAIPTFAAYQALFAGWTNELAIGEASTTNFMARACERIHTYLPDARLILILRQPADRAYSQFLHTRRMGLEPLTDFAQALADEEARTQNPWLPAFTYTRAGFYAPILQQYLDCFPREQLRIYLYEEWQAQTLPVLQDIFGFIGVEPGFVPDTAIRLNTAAVPRNRWLVRFLRGTHPLKQWLKPLLPAHWRQRTVRTLSTYNLTKPPPFDPHLRTQLNQLYRHDIQQTAALIGRDLSHWLA